MGADSATTKPALRARILAARAALPDREGRSQAACAHLSGWLAQNHPGAVLAGYWPIRAEVDSRPVLAAHSGPTCLPVVTGADAPLSFRRWRPGEAVIGGPFGTSHPEEGAESMQPQVVIVPLVAFDRRGMRLGYGGGFYDRTLLVLRGQGLVHAVGIGFAMQEQASIPDEAHDHLLNLIVTESGLIWPEPR